MEHIELLYKSGFFNSNRLIWDLQAVVLSLEEKQLALLKSVIPKSSLFWTSFLVNHKHFVFICLCFLLLLVAVIIVKYCQTRKQSASRIWSQETDINIFDLVKTAYERGHTEEAIRLIEKLSYDVNDCLLSSGLTLFLCACLSGKKEMIHYMLKKGAKVTSTTKDGDCVLYLATFGVLSSKQPDVSVLEMLISAGCEINAANNKGFTPLHQAASKGNVKVIKYLLSQGANPYKCNKAGTYPIDSAVNAGYLKAAELLRIDVANPHVWEVVEPHTPTRIQLGLQSPQRRLLLESSRRHTFKRILT